MAIGNESNHVIEGLSVNGAFGVANPSNAAQIASVDYSRMATLVRTTVAMRTLGYYAETFPQNATANSSALATGILYTTSIGLLAGDVVTNINIRVATAGSSLTLFKVALLDKNGNRLAVSADQQSAGAVAVGQKQIAMTTPYTVVADDLYYVAMLSVGTTGPAVVRALSVGTESKVTGSSYANCGFVNAQADIAATNTIVTTGATVMLQLWAAIS